MMQHLRSAPTDPWWWFTFAGRAGDDSRVCVGVTIVQACCFEHAHARTFELGCNPGECELLASAITPNDLECIPAEFRNRLLTPSEAETLKALLPSVAGPLGRVPRIDA
jgi:hypothetical protein